MEFAEFHLRAVAILKANPGKGLKCGPENIMTLAHGDLLLMSGNDFVEENWEDGNGLFEPELIAMLDAPTVVPVLDGSLTVMLGTPGVFSDVNELVTALRTIADDIEAGKLSSRVDSPTGVNLALSWTNDM